MVKKRKTTDDDFERLAENIERNFTIKDDTDFDKAFEVYIGKTLTPKQKTLRNKSRTEFREKFGFRVDVTKELKPMDKEKDGVVLKNRGSILFNFTGRSSGKVVKARKIFVEVKGKKVMRFRDRKGRFVRVINK